MLIQRYEYTAQDYNMYLLTRDLGRMTKCTHKQVGCVILGTTGICGVGYNTVHECNLQCNKTCKVLHAERAALMNGVVGMAGTAYVNLFPCLECQAALAHAGIQTIVVFGEQGNKELGPFYGGARNIEMLPDLPSLLVKMNGEKRVRQIVQGEAAELITAISNYDARDDRPESRGQLLDDVYGEIVDVELQLLNLKQTLPPDLAGPKDFKKWNKLIAKFQDKFFHEDTLNKGPSS